MNTTKTFLSIFFLLISTITIFGQGNTCLEQGDWKYAIKRVMDNGGTSYKDELYQGEKFKGSRSGLGAYFFVFDNESYWGNFAQGESSGKGIYIVGKEDYQFLNCPGCNYYVGNYSNDVKNGLGKCYDKTGKLLYYGAFENELPKESFPQSHDNSYKFECHQYESGDLYLGETFKNVRQGLGILFEANGNTWYGEWRDGKRNGNGIEIQYNGFTKSGTWNNDIFEENAEPAEKPIELITENQPAEQKPAEQKPAEPKATEQKKAEQKQTEHVKKSEPAEKSEVQRSAKEPKPAPQPVNEILKRDGKKIYLNGRELTEQQVRSVMAQTDAFKLYNKGISYNKKGNALITFGTIFALGGATVWILDATVDMGIFQNKIQSTNISYSRLTAYIALGVGGAMLIPGITLKCVGKSKIKKSVYVYNKANTPTAELKCNFTGLGVNFTVTF